MLGLYSLRSMLARPAATLAIVFVLFATIGSSATMFSLLEGLTTALDQSGAAENVVVVEKGAQVDTDSTMAIELINKIAVSPGIDHQGSTALRSPELVASLLVRDKQSGLMASILVRGVDPIAMSVHPMVQMIEGTFPSAGQRGVVVGEAERDKRHVGDTVRVGRHAWPITGVFRAKGTMFESELWADRTALAQEMQRTSFSLASVRLAQPIATSRSQLVASLANDRANPLDVVSERAFYGRRAVAFASHVRTIFFVTLILALGAISACINTVYSLFLQRRGELATLLAIGFTKQRVMGLLVFETIALSMLGCALAVVFVLFLDGRHVEIASVSLTFPLRASARVLLAATAIAVIIGAASSITAASHTQKLDVLAAIRA